MMVEEKKRLIRVRDAKRAKFRRDGFGKKPQIADSWRKPRGLHNKQRRQKKAKGAHPTPGYGSPVAVRGMHPSGYYEIRVFSPDELSGMDPAVSAVRIGATVGGRKRAIIQEKAISAGLKVLNPKAIVVRTAPEEPATNEEASDD
ncbi:MAG TPA: 50S ribosomal protein L32e [Methanoregulaceae archaeon]|nr:50S ribosomal protein L32e [Methanoregulaceae archaeon]